MRNNKNNNKEKFKNLMINLVPNVFATAFNRSNTSSQSDQLFTNLEILGSSYAPIFKGLLCPRTETVWGYIDGIMIYN